MFVIPTTANWGRICLVFALKDPLPDQRRNADHVFFLKPRRKAFRLLYFPQYKYAPNKKTRYANKTGSHLRSKSKELTDHRVLQYC